MSDLIATTLHVDCTGKCEACERSCQHSRPVVQSAEDIVDDICVLSTSGYIDWREQAAKLIAAQRQAGREEVEEVVNDYQRLTRELDVALNGDGAAKQASLCDIVAQVQKDNFVPAKRYAALVEAGKKLGPAIGGRVFSADDPMLEAVESIRKALSDLDEARKE